LSRGELGVLGWVVGGGVGVCRGRADGWVVERWVGGGGVWGGAGCGEGGEWWGCGVGGFGVGGGRGWGLAQGGTRVLQVDMQARDGSEAAVSSVGVVWGLGGGWGGVANCLRRLRGASLGLRLLSAGWSRDEELAGMSVERQSVSGVVCLSWERSTGSNTD